MGKKCYIFGSVLFVKVIALLVFICLLSKPINGQQFYTGDNVGLQSVAATLSFEIDGQTVLIDDLNGFLQEQFVSVDTSSFVSLFKEAAMLLVEQEKYEEGALLSKHFLEVLNAPKSKYAGDLYNFSGYFYSHLNSQLNSLDCYLKLLELKTLHGDSPLLSLGNITVAYVALEDYEKALKYNKQALYLTERIPDPEKRSYNLIFEYSLAASIYENLDSLYLAESYYNKSLEMAYEYLNEDLILLSLCYLIKLHDDKSDNDQAEKYIEEGNLLIEQNCVSTHTDKFFLAASTYYLNTDQIAKAKHPDDLSYSNYYLAERYEYAIKYFNNIKDVENINKYYKLLIASKDSINVENEKKIVSNIENTFKASRLENRNEALLVEKTTREKYMLFAFSTFLMILGMLFLQMYNYKKTKKLNASLQLKTIELEETNEDLIVSNEELERFAHIASHDLKTPLHNIIKFSGLLELKLKSNDDEVIKECLYFIKNGGTRMHNIIVDVLEYSKLSKRRNVKELQTIDLNEVIGDISNSISGHIKELNGEVNILGVLPSIKGDYSRMFLLFKNFIENGLKYNKSGNPMVEFYYGKNSETHSIYIRDNGIGIPEEYFDRIFIMFNRLHNHEEYEGTGLGLATCKKIVTELNGEINIESEIGKGTVFEIKLPSDLFVETAQTVQTVNI